MLDIKNITVKYGKSTAISNIFLEVAEGEVISIIGANGSGKSTILNVLSRLVPLTSGEIWFNGQRVDRREPMDVVRLGVSVLLIEQNVHLAFEVASKAYTLQVGSVVRHGEIASMKSDDIVKKAYLGG